MVPVLFLLLLALAALAGMAAGGVSYEKKLRRRVAGQFGRRPEEDYALREGPANTQNAIRLLGLLGCAPGTVRRAEELAKQGEETP